MQNKTIDAVAYPSKNNGKAVLRVILEYAFLATFVILFVVFSLVSNGFFTTMNFVQLLTDCAPYFVLCCGVTFIILTGNLDLSVGATMLVAGHICLALSKAEAPAVVSIIVPLLAGLLIGYVNSVLITKLKMKAFIATMGMMILLRGITLTITGGLYYYPKGILSTIMNYRIGGLVPATIILSIILIVVFQIVLKKSTFGRHLIAAGCNAPGAAKMGIHVDRIKTAVYMLAGFCAALAGMMTVHNVGAASAATGLGAEFTSSAMVLLGGTSLFGGKGTFAPGIFLGVGFMMMIQNGLTVIGVDPYFLTIVRGACIFLAMFTDSIKSMLK